MVIFGGPAAAAVGWKLMAAGVSHFTATAAILVNKGGSWDNASNYAGISSPTININTGWGDSKSKPNGVTQQEPLVKPIAKDDVRNMKADGGNSGMPTTALIGSPTTGDNLATATLAWISYDIITPEPTDAAWPKWAAYTVAAEVSFAYLYGGDIVAKMDREIDRIKERAAGPPGYQYALTANTSGYYPIMTFGSAEPTGTTYLNAGDVWKYGETTSSTRYEEGYLKSIGAGGVTELPQFYGNQMQIKIQEKIMIYNYFLTHGQLPAGNKIFR
jgi:hypothetical protein